MGLQMSAMVPPTRVAPVDPNEPPRKRAMITVCIFGALLDSLAEALPIKCVDDLQGDHDVRQREAKCRHDI